MGGNGKLAIKRNIGETQLKDRISSEGWSWGWGLGTPCDRAPDTVLIGAEKRQRGRVGRGWVSLEAEKMGRCVT